MPPSRVILHADMDAFYASVEQRDDPSLRGLPVMVGGAGPRGVVAAASYEAREFGVRSAMSSAEARKRCPQGIFLPGSMGRYAAESRRIFEIFRRFTPLVEGLSLDEAFLDLSGSERLLGTPAEVGARLRAEVRAETQLAVSVGIAPGKRVAKIASDLAKPDGLLEVVAAEVQAFLAPLPLRWLWGVGAVGEGRLRAAGFETLGDLARANPDQLEAGFGDLGRQASRLARGEDDAPVEPSRAPVSYSEDLAPVPTWSSPLPELMRSNHIVMILVQCFSSVVLDTRPNLELSYTIHLSQNSGVSIFRVAYENHGLRSVHKVTL